MEEKGKGDVTITSTGTDSTLPLPEIERISYGSYGIAVYFSNSFEITDPYEGCEVQISKEKDFATKYHIKEDHTNNYLADDDRYRYGYTYITFNEKKAPPIIFAPVHTKFRIIKKSQVLGPLYNKSIFLLAKSFQENLNTHMNYIIWIKMYQICTPDTTELYT